MARSRMLWAFSVCVSPINPYVEALILNMMVFEDGAIGIAPSGRSQKQPVDGRGKTAALDGNREELSCRHPETRAAGRRRV